MLFCFETMFVHIRQTVREQPDTRILEKPPGLLRRSLVFGEVKNFQTGSGFRQRPFVLLLGRLC